MVRRRGYLFVLLFLGQPKNCISSWHILENPKSVDYLASAGTVPCALFSNTPCSNSSPSPATAVHLFLGRNFIILVLLEAPFVAGKPFPCDGTQQ